MLLHQLANNTNIVRARVSKPDFNIMALHCDSRLIDSQTGFFAIKGFREDGHLYIDDALARGAPILFLTDQEMFDRMENDQSLAGLFLVKGGRRSLAEISGAIWGIPSERMNLLGVTGTNGKTTVTHFAARMLAELGKNCGIIGSLGLVRDSGRITMERTTPEAPDIHKFLSESLLEGVDTVAIEVSSIGIALDRVHTLSFRAAAFTNLSQDHLDFHGTMGSYRDTKFHLFLKGDIKAAVINFDDQDGMLLAERLSSERPEIPQLTFAITGEADLGFLKLETDDKGSSGVIRYKEKSIPFKTGLLGKFNMSNLLTALGLLLAAGEDFEELMNTIGSCRAVPGRFENIPLPQPFKVVVDYAHTPDALENALLTARQLTQGRVLCLFGCGGDRDQAKRPLMGSIAERLSDGVFITSDNPRSEDPEVIIAQIAEGVTHHEGAVIQIPDRREAIFRILDQASEGDIVIIAGKGHENYQEIDGEKHHFDDREIVLEWDGGQ